MLLRVRSVSGWSRPRTALPVRAAMLAVTAAALLRRAFAHASPVQ